MSTLSASHLSPDVQSWVLQSFNNGDTIQSVALLYGGISAKVCLIEVKGKHGVQPVVLRLFTDQEWLKREPDLAKQEADNLRAAHRAPVATPELIAFDETGAQCSHPAVLMTHLPGKVELQPQDFRLWTSQMAEALVAVHQVEAPEHPWKYRTYNDIPFLEIPAWSDLPLWTDAIRLVQGPRPVFRERFIHRDYHPTNVLWQDNQVSGVVDWVNSCLGPQGIDVGHCRLNLALLHGVEAADQFLDAYRSLAGSTFAYDPYWDLVSAIEFLPGPPEVYAGWTALGFTGLTDQLMKERYEAYVASLLRRW